MNAPDFTAAHAETLLAYVGSVDDRFRETDAVVAQARTRAWASILTGVDPGFALHHARRYYSKTGQPRITPSEIRSAWSGHQRREESKTRPPAPVGGPAPSGVGEYLRQVVRAVQAGRDASTIPRPASTLTPEADIAGRRCRLWRQCACDHRSCRDGWLDQEERIVNGLGKSYPAVKQCPHCRDAAVMAAELATPTRRR